MPKASVKRLIECNKNQLIDLVEPLIQYIESYKPDYVILNDTRGVHEGEWFSGTIYKKIRKHEKKIFLLDI